MTELVENRLVIEDGVLKSCSLKGISSVEVPHGVHTIGEGAFKGCTSIEQIMLPDTVTVIMADAFKGCRKLSRINLPNGLEAIGDYAFHRCHQMKEIELPSTVKQLGNCVFLYCDSLESVRMPGVKSLGLQVFLNDVCLKHLLISTELDPNCICDCFTGCGRMETIEFSDGTVYQMENAVAVLSSGDAAPPLVTAIATDICRMMELEEGVITRFLTNIKHVELAEGITAIGKSCFFDKKGIISMKLPSSLREIGSRAFRNCINLERVEFCGSQVVIHKDAFKNCTTLRYIRMEDGTEYELTGLRCLEDETVPDVVREIHAQVLGNFAISGTTLVKYRGSEARVVVPDGITVIGERAFAGNEAIDRVILPGSVKIIEEEAFADCLVLQTIGFPEGLEKLGKSAFENCVKLIRAVLPDSLTVISKSAFNRCRLLNEVQFGDKVTTIESLAFYGCQKLRNITLPETLFKLGDMAFYKCLTLKEIVLPPGLKELGSNAFTLSGIRMASVRCELSFCGSDVFSQCTRLRRLYVEDGVCRIGDRFAFHCENLSVVDLPSSLVEVGRHAFEGSRFLKELGPDGVVNGILLDGSGLEGDVTLPAGMISIAGGAFYGNRELTSVILPDTISHIGSGAFCGCTGLTHVELPPKAAALEESLFLYCTSLRAVRSRGVMKSVGSRAFSGCRSLTEIPSLRACAWIGKEAFLECRGLEVIELPKTSQGERFHIGEHAFAGTLFLKKMEEESGNTAASWLGIISGVVTDGTGCEGHLEIPEGITAISDYAFCGNERITSLHLPETLELIGESAFAGCKSLERVVFAGDLLSIGRSAFEKCIALRDLSCRTREIGSRAFAWCRELGTASVEAAETIGSEAFCGCQALVRCQFPQARRIGEEAFSGCASLADAELSALEQIGARAFERCDSLREISLKEDADVGAHAFEDCGRLTAVRVRKNSLIIGSYAFSGCTAVSEVQLGEQIYHFDGYRSLFDRSIPETARRVYGSALSCFSIDEEGSLSGYDNSGRFVTIPEGVHRIEGEVFKDRARLEELVIPDSVEYIGPRAFDKTLWLSRQLENRESRYQKPKQFPAVVVKGILTAADPDRCRGEIAIPSGVRRISGWAFANCTDLTGVLFLSDRIAVEDHAFRNCIHLKRVVLSDQTEYQLSGLQTLKDDLPPVVRQIFADCYHCFKTDSDGCLIECTGNISRVTLPLGITAVGDGALKESNLLTCMTLTEEVTSIGRSAFEQCKWLDTVANTAQVTTIGSLAFSGCVRLSHIGAFRRLTSLGERAFENCTSLEEIILPEGLEEIPRRAFFRCHQLRKVTFPSSLRRIGREAFAFCYELTDVVLPEGVECVEERAFVWCGTHGQGTAAAAGEPAGQTPGRTAAPDLLCAAESGEERL